MSTYKILLLGLLLLISLPLLFSMPSSNLVDIYSYDHSRLPTHPSLSETISFSIAYPPGQILILNSILSLFPKNPNISDAYQQNASVALALLRYLFYLSTYFSLIYLTKSLKLTKLISLKDLGIAYFSSFAITLTSLSLGYLNIIAAPFFVVSLTLYLKKKYNLAALSFFLALLFDWSLLIFGPIFLFYTIYLSRRFTHKNIIPYLVYLIMPLIYSIILSYQTNLQSDILMLKKGGLLINFLSLVNLSFTSILHVPQPSTETTTAYIFYIAISLLILICISFFFNTQILDQLRIANKTLNRLLFLSSWLATAATLIIPTIRGTFLILIVATLITKIIIKLKNQLPSPILGLTGALFCSYATALIFLPFATPGNTFWLVVLGIIIFILRQSQFSALNLLTVNLVLFLTIFSVYGVAGNSPINAAYFQYFQYFFAIFFIIYAAWFYLLYTKEHFLETVKSKLATNHKLIWLKVFLILTLITVNLSLIGGGGSPDTTSWNQYAIATIQHPNPFLAQTVVDQRYPPLSTAIIGIFANFWKVFLQNIPNPQVENHDYLFSTRISILFFYTLTVFTIIKFSTQIKNHLSSLLNQLVIILTTFSLIIQTQGLADVNIYLIPSLFYSIYLLFKRRLFWSGLLMGITLSIKWQPIIILPLYFATLLTLTKLNLQTIKPVLLFCLGLIPIPVITWLLVLIQPGGQEAFERAFEYLKNGAPMLSGQALNVDWIVTYFIHIFRPDPFKSIEYLGGLNRQVPSDYAPIIFQGTLFIAAAAIIFVRYWAFQKKNLVTFLSASIMIFFSHHILNKSAYEKHLFYTVILMLFLYLVRPTDGNKKLLILFDIMTVMNLILFYGFTGPKDINRLVFGFDITIIFSAYYIIIYLWVMYRYLKKEGLLFGVLPNANR